MKGGNGKGWVDRARSAGDKEKTRLRERQRRSITTKIFNGLRTHGNYNLAPRADINDVLRALAREAGWVVEPDGTTYRSNFKVHQAASSKMVLGPPPLQRCPTCGASGSYGWAITGEGIGGDCSSTASPRHLSLQQPSNSSGDGDALVPASASWHLYYPLEWAWGPPSRNPKHERDSSQALTGGELAAECLLGGAQVEMVGHEGTGEPHLGLPHRPFAFFHEARASNDSTPIASPQRHQG